MQNLDDVIAACRSFRLGESDMFHAIIAGTLQFSGLLQRELAAYLKVQQSTISRWRRGDRLPHPRMQVSYVRDIGRRLNRPKSYAKHAA